jgi:hypothetical protein
MSEEQSPAATGEAGPQKKKGVSPARNAIGLVALVVVVAVGAIQYTALARFNSAVKALNDRMAVEDKELMTEPEAEALIGKAPDDAGSDVQIGTASYTKKTYTWKALLKPYTLSAYYTKGKTPLLHHTESEGEKYAPEQNAAPPPPEASAKGEGPGPGMPKAGGMRKGGGERGNAKAKGGGAPKVQEEPKADDKTKAGADEKAKGPELKADDKAKAGADEKTQAGADETAKTPEKAT